MDRQAMHKPPRQGSRDRQKDPIARTDFRDQVLPGKVRCLLDAIDVVLTIPIQHNGQITRFRIRLAY
jgi:hypothetical protein